MSPIVYTFLLLSTIYYFSRTNQQNVYRFIFLVTRSQTVSLILYWLIFFPGTLIHEVSHLLMAVFTGTRVKEISLTPSSLKKAHHANHGTPHMGYVVHEERNPVINLLIGFAPLLGGLIMLSILFITYFSSSDLSLWKNLTVGYLVFSITSTMFLSYSDMRDLLKVVLLIILITLAYLALPIKISVEMNVIAPLIYPYVRTLNTYLFASLTMHGVLFTIGVIYNKK